MNTVQLGLGCPCGNSQSVVPIQVMKFKVTEPRDASSDRWVQYLLPLPPLPLHASSFPLFLSPPLRLNHGLINYIDAKAKCRHLQILSFKGT
jgi:hypothetical protein